MTFCPTLSCRETLRRFALTAAALVALIGLAAPVSAQPCPECAVWRDALDRARTHQEDLSRAAREASEKAETARAEVREFENSLVDGSGAGPGWRDRLDELVAAREAARIASQSAWNALSLQKAEVADLEEALRQCRLANCSGPPPFSTTTKLEGAATFILGGSGSALPGDTGGDFGFPPFDWSHCPDRCPDLRDQVRELEDELWGPDHSPGEAAAEGSAVEQARRAVERSRELERGVADAATRLEEASSDAVHESLSEEFDRLSEEYEQALDRRSELVNRVFELEDRLRELRQLLSDCADEECGDEEATEDQSMALPKFEFFAGVLGGAFQWDHPDEVVGGFLDSVDVAGATETSSTETDDTAIGFQLGIRFPVMERDCGSFWLGGGVSLFQGPEFSARGEIGLDSQGVMLDAIVDFVFEGDTIFAPELLFRYESNNNYYFQLGTTYFETPLELRTIERYFINGQLDEEIETVQEVDDSAFGFNFGIGFVGERWQLGVDYRQAEINDADLRTVTANLGFRF